MIAQLQPESRLTKVINLLAVVVQKLSILPGPRIRQVHQLQHQWPFRHDACPPRQEVLAHHCLKHGTFTGAL